MINSHWEHFGDKAKLILKYLFCGKRKNKQLNIDIFSSVIYGCDATWHLSETIFQFSIFKTDKNWNKISISDRNDVKLDNLIRTINSVKKIYDKIKKNNIPRRVHTTHDGCFVEEEGNSFVCNADGVVINAASLHFTVHI